MTCTSNICLCAVFQSIAFICLDHTCLGTSCMQQACSAVATTSKILECMDGKCNSQRASLARHSPQGFCAKSVRQLLQQLSLVALLCLPQPILPIVISYPPLQHQSSISECTSESLLNFQLGGLACVASNKCGGYADSEDTEQWGLENLVKMAAYPQLGRQLSLANPIFYVIPAKTGQSQSCHERSSMAHPQACTQIVCRSCVAAFLQEAIRHFVVVL